MAAEGPPGVVTTPPQDPGTGRPRAGGPRVPRLRFLVLGVALAVLLTAGLFVVLLSVRPTGGSLTGSAVPPFSLPRVGGSGHVGVPSDGGGRGRPAVLLFFASWCGPCKAEIPSLARLYHHQHAAGSPLAKVALIGVDASDPTGDALAFMRRSGVTFPVGADEVFGVTSGKFGFSHLPEAVFVAADGTVEGFHLGALSASSFVAWEHRLLATG